MSNIGAVGGVLTTIPDKIISGLNNFWNNIGSNIATFFYVIDDFVQGALLNTLNFLFDFLDKIPGALQTLFGWLFPNIGAETQKIIENVKEILFKLESDLSTYLDGLTMDLIDFFADNIFLLNNDIYEICEFIKYWFNFIFGFISSILGAISKTVMDTWDQISKTINDTLTAISKTITDKWNEISKTVSDTLTGIYNYVSAQSTAISTYISTTLAFYFRFCCFDPGLCSKSCNGCFKHSPRLRSLSLMAILKVVTDKFNEISATVTTILTAISKTIKDKWTEIRQQYHDPDSDLKNNNGQVERD